MNILNVHLPHLRLKLGWLLLASRQHLQLLLLFGKVVCNEDLDNLRVEHPAVQYAHFTIE